MTLNTPSLYTGTAVTTQNVVRKVAGVTMTDVAGAGTFAAPVGQKYDILFGVDSNSGTAQPYGPKVQYTVPCEPTPSVEQTVVDDALATDLTALAFNPDTGNVISPTETLTMVAGTPKTVAFRWTGSYQEDFGNRYCEDNEGKSNVLVVRYNTTQYTKVAVTDLSGNAAPAYNGQISKILSSASGFSDATFTFPVLRSSADYNYKLVLTPSTTVTPIGSQGNVTLYLYSDNWFINTDVSPAVWSCDIMNQNGGATGAAAADTLVVYIAG